MSQRLSKKIFHICMIMVIIIAIIFTALMFILRYDENGEENMPFGITKISIISTVDGKDVENSSNKWELNVIQNNDIYIYIEKNEEYKKQETIKSVTLDNFQITEIPKIGELNIYKPVQNANSIFENLSENIAKEIKYTGDLESNIQNMKISNQGGIIAFRVANDNIGKYISNEDEEINYNKLLSKMNIKEEEIKAKISFDLKLELDSRITFKATLEQDIPIEEIVEKGRTTKEIVELKNVVFKRLENKGLEIS